jgi:hypothetical protein
MKMIDDGENNPAEDLICNSKYSHCLGGEFWITDDPKFEEMKIAGPIYDSPYHLMEHWDRVVAPICQMTFMDSNP